MIESCKGYQNMDWLGWQDWRHLTGKRKKSIYRVNWFGVMNERRGMPSLSFVSQACQSSKQVRW